MSSPRFKKVRRRPSKTLINAVLETEEERGASSNQKMKKIIAQNVFPALEATPSSPLHESQLHSPLDSPPAPLEKKTESKKLSNMFLEHEIGEFSTTKLKWKSSPDPFIFGSFKSVNPLEEEKVSPASLSGETSFCLSSNSIEISASKGSIAGTRMDDVVGLPHLHSRGEVILKMFSLACGDFSFFSLGGSLHGLVRSNTNVWSHPARYTSLANLAHSLDSCNPTEQDVSQVLKNLGDKVLEQDVVIVINNMENSVNVPLVLKYFQQKIKPNREVIPYNVTLKVFRKCKDLGGAEKVFDEMLERGVEPDNVTFSTIISCARVCYLPNKAVEWFETDDLALGKQAHNYICDNNITVSVTLCNSLTDMYAKCGALQTTASKNVEEVDGKVGSGALFVKVNMDGAPYLRKVDLKNYSAYSELSSALEKLFSYFTKGQCGSLGNLGREMLNENKLKDPLHGSEYVLTYEDKDGDWMLVGDVPLEMFIDKCRGLWILLNVFVGDQLLAWGIPPLKLFSEFLSKMQRKTSSIGGCSTNANGIPTDREVALMMLMAYLSYMLAELISLSGILTVFFCGIVMSHYTWHNVTENSIITTKHAFATLSLVAEIFTVLYVALACDVDGVHVGNKLAVQEFVILPDGSFPSKEAMKMGVKVFNHLRKVALVPDAQLFTFSFLLVVFLSWFQVGID